MNYSVSYSYETPEPISKLRIRDTTLTAGPVLDDAAVEGFRQELRARHGVRVSIIAITPIAEATVEREARDGEIIGWSVKHGIRDLTNAQLRAAWNAARTYDLTKP